MVFQSNSYFSEQHYIGRNLWVGHLFILFSFLIILLEFVLFIYVCSFVRVFIAVFYWFFENFKQILQIIIKKKWKKCKDTYLSIFPLFESYFNLMLKQFLWLDLKISLVKVHDEFLPPSLSQFERNELGTTLSLRAWWHNFQVN